MFIFLICALFAESVRLKDIVSFESVRDNFLVGYGLVTGLNGTGDNATASPYTKESTIAMLERLGVNTRGTAYTGKNIAAVMVTATLPAFARHGSKIDVNVSAIGDAKDLKGGTLLVTPLLGADGEVYAVAQGSIAVSGFKIEGRSGSLISKGVPTTGRILNAALVEKEIPFRLNSLSHMHLSLRNPDFTTAKRVADVIISSGITTAQALDPGTVVVKVPAKYKNHVVAFMSQLEQLRITPDQVAKIVIDDHEGVAVFNENVRISTVALTQGSITIRISETPQVSQPNPFTQVAQATQVERSDISVKEESGKIALMEEGATLLDLVNGLNALQVTPREMIVILQSIKAVGALQADIEIF